MNPVVLLDEIDKVGSDYRGDPAAALLEVLDPDQNHTFRDHYLDVDLDLSDVVFLATANVLEAIPAPVRDSSELQSVIAAQAREPNGGLIVMPDSFMDAYRAEITSLAARYRLPAVYPSRVFADVGGLLSYGVDRTVNFRRAATYVDRILKGEKPAELPVQTPTKYELVINLKTAKALGVTIAPALLAGADEVIE